MNIGIDGTVLSQKYQSGQKRCLENLILGLSKIDKNNNYYIFVRNKIKIINQPNFKTFILPKWLPILKRQIAIPLVSFIKKIDVFYFPDVWGSVVPPAKRTIVTFHDLAPPSSYPVWYKSLKYFLMQIINYFTRTFTLRNASKIILVTESIKEEYKEKYGRDKRLVVVKQAIPEIFKGINPSFSKSKYFMAFADFSPRKNINGVLYGFGEFVKSRKDFRNFRIKVVVSTKYPVLNITSLAKKIGIEGNIDLMIGISNQELIRTYRKSLALIYPSLYEGFGFPILEAYACGCPVITSNFGATKETSGGAAILVDPLKYHDISKAMLKLATNKKVLNQMIIKGLEHTKKYSWNKTSMDTLKVFKEVYGYKK